MARTPRLFPLALAGALAATAVLAAPAPAAKTLLWATVNMCDTPRHPDTLGLRGSMPGTGDPGTMYMRFRVQWFNPAKRRWQAVKGTNADSGYIRAGSSRWKVRQTGAYFRFRPAPGAQFTLRGLVDFEWRAGGRVVKRARKITEAGRRSAVGADPPGYSEATCVITGEPLDGEPPSSAPAR